MNWDSSIFYSNSLYETKNYYIKSSFLNKMYTYYIGRGFFNIISNKIVNLLITSIIAFFIIFLTNCVDYASLMSLNSDTQLSQIINMSSFFDLHYSALFLFICFCVFLFLKILSIIDDFIVFKKIKYFYNDILEIDEDEIQFIIWDEVIQKIKSIYGTETNIDIYYITSRITSKDNYLVALFDHNIIEINHLTNIMEWNIIYCIIDTLFNDESGLKLDFIENKEYYIETIKRRLRIVAVLNYIFMPIIFIFILLYNLFNYGETFYNRPDSLVKRNWSRLAYWKYRSYNELFDVYDERLKKSDRIAESYSKQFPNRNVEIFARLIVFFSSAVFILFVVFSFLNQNVLIDLYITENRSVLWYMGIFASIIAVFKNLISDKFIFYPKEKMDELSEHLDIPKEWVEKSNHNSVKKMFFNFYELHISTLIKNILYTLIVPFQLWSLSYDVKDVIDFVEEVTIDDDKLGTICKFADFDNNRLCNNQDEVKTYNSFNRFKNKHNEWYRTKMYNF
jgi:autophagy-related protein 9